MNFDNRLLSFDLIYAIISTYITITLPKRNFEEMAKQRYLECGRAVSTHGVRGTLRLESYCDEPEVLAKLRTLYIKKENGEFEPMKVRAASVQKQMVLCTLEAVTTLEEAIRYKGTTFFADRADFKLHGNAVFIADIIGLPVLDHATGEHYGDLAEVITPGGREVYVINDVNGGTFMLPSVPEFVKRIETEGDEAGIYVELIEGMREAAK